MLVAQMAEDAAHSEHPDDSVASAQSQPHNFTISLRAIRYASTRAQIYRLYGQNSPHKVQILKGNSIFVTWKYMDGTDQSGVWGNSVQIITLA